MFACVTTVITKVRLERVTYPHGCIGRARTPRALPPSGTAHWASRSTACSTCESSVYDWRAAWRACFCGDRSVRTMTHWASRIRGRAWQCVRAAEGIPNRPRSYKRRACPLGRRQAASFGGMHDVGHTRNNVVWQRRTLSVVGGTLNMPHCVSAVPRVGGVDPCGTTLRIAWASCPCCRACVLW